MITVLAVIEQVRDVVALQPSRVYPTRPSRYVHRTRDGWGCSCLVGHALVALGIDPAMLDDLDDDGDGFNAGWMLMQLVKAGQVQAWAKGPDAYAWQTQRPIQWLVSVQSAQDDMVPWGFCIVRADAEFPLDM